MEMIENEINLQEALKRDLEMEGPASNKQIREETETKNNK